MKSNQQRINIVIGQLEGIKKMIEGDEDCLKIIIQFKAVKSALNSVMGQVIKENAKDCLKNVKGKGVEKMDQIIQEMVKL